MKNGAFWRTLLFSCQRWVRKPWEKVVQAMKTMDFFMPNNGDITLLTQQKQCFVLPGSFGSILHPGSQPQMKV